MFPEKFMRFIFEAETRSSF